MISSDFRDNVSTSAARQSKSSVASPEELYSVSLSDSKNSKDDPPTETNSTVMNSWIASSYFRVSSPIAASQPSLAHPSLHPSAQRSSAEMPNKLPVSIISGTSPRKRKISQQQQQQSAVHHHPESLSHLTESP